MKVLWHRIKLEFFGIEILPNEAWQCVRSLRAMASLAETDTVTSSWWCLNSISAVQME